MLKFDATDVNNTANFAEFFFRLRTANFVKIEVCTNYLVKSKKKVFHKINQWLQQFSTVIHVSCLFHKGRTVVVES